MASLDDFDEDNELVTAELGNLGLTAAGFDYFHLEDLISHCMGLRSFTETDHYKL